MSLSMVEGLDPSVVKPSRHSLYMRGFNAGVRPDDVRRHFVERGQSCSVVFFATVRGALNVALRFESHDVAKRVLHKYNDGTTLLLGCRVSIVWFKDMQAARERVRNDPGLRRMLEQRGAFRPTGGPYGRGGSGGNGGGGGGGGWQRRRGESFGGNDMQHQLRYEDGTASSSMSRSSRSRSRSRTRSLSRSAASVDSRKPRQHQQPPPAAPSHRPESPPSPSQHSRSPTRSRSPSPSPSPSRSRSRRGAVVVGGGSGVRSRSPSAPSASASAAPALNTAAAPAAPHSQSSQQQQKPATAAPTAGQLVRRRKAEIEAAYRQDCETFATVVKMLLRHDPTLDGPIQAALKASLRDIGDQSVAELKQYIEGLRRAEASVGPVDA